MNLKHIYPFIAADPVDEVPLAHAEEALGEPGLGPASAGRRVLLRPHQDSETEEVGATVTTLGRTGRSLSTRCGHDHS